MNDLGRFLMITGVVIAAAGVILTLLPRISWLGKLPGDILLRKGNVTFFFPLTTSIILSLLLSLILWLFRR
jgi:hypothetical protein